MSSDRYATMMSRLYETVPEMTASERREAYVVSTRQIDGLRSRATARHHEFAVDEPQEWSSDSAANPAELALGALGASLEVTCRVYAAHLGVEPRQISTELRGALDLGAFLGTSEGSRAGFENVVVTLQLETDRELGAAELEKLAQAINRSCPMLDVFRSPIPVALDVQN